MPSIDTYASNHNIAAYISRVSILHKKRNKQEDACNKQLHLLLTRQHYLVNQKETEITILCCRNDRPFGIYEMCNCVILIYTF